MIAAQFSKMHFKMFLVKFITKLFLFEHRKPACNIEK